MQDFQDAIDRVIGGLEKKNKIIFRKKRKSLLITKRVMLLQAGSWNMLIRW